MTPKMTELRATSSFWYMATSFTKHPDGHDVAFRQAASVAAFFMRLGIPVFAPIAHGYPAQHTGDLPTDHDFWMNIDQPFMDASSGMVVVMMPGWDESEGIAFEIDVFEKAGKPVLYMEFPPSFGTDDAKIAAYYAEQEKDDADRSDALSEWPEPEFFDSAFDTKAELAAKVAK